MAKFWLFKTEPGTFSFETLAKEKKTNWNGVRNYQARNTLRECRKGEFVIIYHSGDERSAVGVAQVTAEAYPDPDEKKPGDWVQVDLKYIMKIKTPVTLSVMKSTAALKNMPLIRHTRLSCMEITATEFENLLKLGESWDAFQK